MPLAWANCRGMASSQLPTLALKQEIELHVLQTIAEGWAYPLKGFMNEQELLESMNMNTVTDREGQRHMLSVPLTLSVTKEQRE